MNIDLNKHIPKVWMESERSVDPDVTIKNANIAAERIGIRPDINTTNLGDVFWTSRLNLDLNDVLPPGVPLFRISGKGQSEKQSIASCIMEFMERLSWSTYLKRIKKDHQCLDLRGNKTYIINPGREMFNSMCVSSGNNYEEALLHSLHELIETRISYSCYWKPHKVAPVELLFPEFPSWVKENIILVQTPSDIEEFYHFYAIKYPANNKFDPGSCEKIIKDNNNIYFSSKKLPINHHSPNSGGAAGLNPRLTAFRAMNEIFQGESLEIVYNKKKDLPDYIRTVNESDLVNNETDSITGDINKILRLLGNDVFIGIIDLTDPVLNIPVIKLISNYNPVKSMVSREIMDIFFKL